MKGAVDVEGSEVSLARGPRPMFKLITVVSLVAGLILLIQYAQASHSHGNQTWNDCGPYGCIGWKNFVTGAPTWYVRANWLYDESEMDQAWGNAIVYWNSTNTAAQYQLNDTPQNYPDARVVPYRDPGSPSWPLARELTYDQRPGDGAFIRCDASCAYAESSTAQYGYDLSEIIFYDYYMDQLTIVNKETAARHELAHTVGLVDHYAQGPGCNPNYFGLMDRFKVDLSGPCNTSLLTCAEKKGVNRVHDKTFYC